MFVVVVKYCFRRSFLVDIAAPQSVDGSAPESTGEAPAPAIDHATGEETPADGQVEAEVRHDVVTEEPQVDAAAETATTSAVASPAASTQKRNLLENTEWRVELTYGSRSDVGN